jgi:heme oxygenase
VKKQQATMTPSSRLRQGSQDLHQVAERSGLMAELLRGRLARSDYTLMLLNLQAIYLALEQGLVQASYMPKMDFAPLFRAEAIARDLAFLAPEPNMQLCAATETYVQRLALLSASGSRLLLAHAYVRYLGDLHGGQMLRRCVSRVLKSEGQEGLSFYDFGPPERVVQLITDFRAGLDAMPLNPQQVDSLMKEVRLGYGMHIDLFSQLHPSGI